MRGWDYDKIAERRRKQVEETFAGKGEEALIARIVELETQLYPLYVALSPITEKSWRGTTATSKLFPLRPEQDEDAFWVYNKDRSTGDHVKLDDSQLAEVDYYLEDSLCIEDGTKLGDDFEIIAFHQQAPGAYVGNGNVTVGDVRRLDQVLNEPYRAPSPQPREVGGA